MPKKASDLPFLVTGFIPTKVPNPPQDLTMLEAHLSGQVAAA